ncbi:MAG: hypothetical protein ACLUPF_06985 [Dorea sp.]
MGKFQNPKCRKPLILLAFPDSSQKYFKNWSPRNVFGKIKNPFLGEFPTFGKRFLEICVFGVVENRNKIQEVRLCERGASKGNAKDIAK